MTLQHVVDGATGNVVTETNSPKMSHLGLWKDTEINVLVPYGYTSAPGYTVFSIAHPQAELGSGGAHRFKIVFSLSDDDLPDSTATNATFQLYVGTNGDTSDEFVGVFYHSARYSSPLEPDYVYYTPSTAIGLTTKLTASAYHQDADPSYTFRVIRYMISDATRTQDIE